MKEKYILIGILLLGSFILTQQKTVVFDKWPSTLTTDTFDGWDHPSCSNDCITKCDRDVFGLFSTGKVTKEFTDLPTHRNLKVLFRLYQNDDWESNEKFMMYLDGLKTLTTNKPTNFPFGDRCGADEVDAVRNTMATFNGHRSKSLSIEMFADLDENVSNESWAISNFELVLENVPTDVETPTPPTPDPPTPDPPTPTPDPPTDPPTPDPPTPDPPTPDPPTPDPPTPDPPTPTPPEPGD